MSNFGLEIPEGREDPTGTESPNGIGGWKGE